MRDQRSNTDLHVDLSRALGVGFKRGWRAFIRTLETLTDPPYWLSGSDKLRWWKQEEGSFVAFVSGYHYDGYENEELWAVGLWTIKISFFEETTTFLKLF
ncbi:MAG: hypothetical protein Q8N55_02220, partial [bacterium]|nr:hypothetical protein [bacterium]